MLRHQHPGPPVVLDSLAVALEHGVRCRAPEATIHAAASQAGFRILETGELALRLSSIFVSIVPMSW